MRLFTRISVLFYVLVLSVLCGTVGLFVTHIISLNDLYRILEIAYHDTDARTILGLVSAGIILLSFLSARIIYGSYQKERTIAFDNPSGRVTVSLSALEDMVRRVVLRVPDIKEVKSGIIATKKGLEVEIRLILKGDMHIPEMTASLQETVKNKIQDTIGIEESVVVKVHVIKISTEEYKPKKVKGEQPEDRQTLPFQGYRA